MQFTHTRLLDQKLNGTAANLTILNVFLPNILRI